MRAYLIVARFATARLCALATLELRLGLFATIRLFRHRASDVARRTLWREFPNLERYFHGISGMNRLPQLRPMYRTFRDKHDSCIKIVMKPG